MIFPIMGMGNKIDLLIARENVDYHSFKCYANAGEWDSPHTFKVLVVTTFCKIVDGYFHHYRIDDLEFVYKKPIYDFTPDEFKTQIRNFEFTFRKASSDSAWFEKD